MDVGKRIVVLQDGSIAEAVIWDSADSERHLIPDSIVAHILARHAPAARLQGFAGILDWTLSGRGASTEQQLQAGRSGLLASYQGSPQLLYCSNTYIVCRVAEAALTRLAKQLRNLTGLALRPMAVQPLSPAARNTAAVRPLPHPLAGGAPAKDGRLARCLDPIELLVQLEGSGVPQTDASGLLP